MSVTERERAYVSSNWFSGVESNLRPLKFVNALKTVAELRVKSMSLTGVSGYIRPMTSFGRIWSRIKRDSGSFTESELPRRTW